jgi:hypothetical protein
MILKKCLMLLAGMLISVPGIASDDLHLLQHVQHQAGFSLLEINDPYLSLLTYEGAGFRYNYVSTSFLKPENPKVSFYNRLDFASGLTSNPASTASVTYVGGAYSFGFRYHFKPYKNFTFLGGGLLRTDYMMRNNSRNVNNPFNMDVAVGLYAQLTGRYDFSIFKKPVFISLNLETPLSGLMFVPHPGLSYYEIYLRKNIMSELHLSSFHNKTGLHQQLKFTIPFKTSVWSIGIQSEYQQYQVYDYVYRHNELSLMMGIQYNLKYFSGTKSKIPDHYLTPGL